jgi:hypothetical protein
MIRAHTPSPELANHESNRQQTMLFRKLCRLTFCACRRPESRPTGRRRAVHRLSHETDYLVRGGQRPKAATRQERVRRCSIPRCPLLERPFRVLISASGVNCAFQRPAPSFSRLAPAHAKIDAKRSAGQRATFVGTLYGWNWIGHADSRLGGERTLRPAMHVLCH